MNTPKNNNRAEIISWLFENGGPVIKYRTILELMTNLNKKKFDVKELYASLLKSDYVQKWLNLQNEMSRGIPFAIHGYKKSFFENYVPKLVQLGIKEGNPMLDRLVQPFINTLIKSVENPVLLQDYNSIIVSSFLAMAGYANNESKAAKTIIDILKNEIYKINNMIEKMGYNIYVEVKNYPPMPASFRGRPLINPEITQNKSLKLPNVYSFFGFAALQTNNLLKIDDQTNLNNIVDYILQSEYQKFHPFPITLNKGDKYHAGAYQMLLPGYFQDPIKDVSPIHPRTIKFLLAVFLMAHFPITLNHPWFERAITYLKEFKTNKGTYIFPRDFLQEKDQGYWIFSPFMGLGENRRKKIWLELESTFWMMKIKKIAGFY